MKVLNLCHHVLNIGAVAVLLADCGGAQLPSSSPGMMPSNRAIRMHANRRSSWMLPQTGTKNLLYIVLGGYVPALEVLSYPSLQQVGSLRGDFDLSGGMCADRVGNIWIITPHGVVEYAHGGHKPLDTISNATTVNTSACAVDPSSENLALVSDTQDAVAVFSRRRSTPTIYSDPNVAFFSCGYNDQGDLLLEGQRRREIIFAMLPKGSSSFTKVTVPQHVFHDFGDIQWDGKYWVILDYLTSYIYRLAISGSTGTVVGRVRLGRKVTDFWIQGSTVVASSSIRNIGVIELFHYPAGGAPIRTIDGGGRDFVVSVARH